MTILRPAGRAGALLIPIVLIVAACGGASASPSGSGTTGASATPTPVAASSGASASLPIGAIPSFDLSQLTAGLDKVDSYHVVMTTDGKEAYSGTVVTKPVLSRDLMIGGDTHVVVIGNEAWMGSAGQPLKSVPSALASALFAVDPAMIVGAFAGPQWAQSSLDKGVEQKNGVSAHHYLIDSTTLVGGFAGVPAGGSINIWIAEAGYLVAWESVGLGSGDTSIQVTGIDDPANKVDRPS